MFDWRPVSSLFFGRTGSVRCSTPKKQLICGESCTVVVMLYTRTEARKWEMQKIGKQITGPVIGSGLLPQEKKISNGGWTRTRTDKHKNTKYDFWGPIAAYKHPSRSVTCEQFKCTQGSTLSNKVQENSKHPPRANKRWRDLCRIASRARKEKTRGM